jgi:tRNA G18 (ribose-2'-O)-methylase SpoU
MRQIHRIDSFEIPELLPYRTMRRQQEQREQGIFVAEGEKVVRRLLESKLGVVSVLMPEKWLSSFDDLLSAREESISVFLAEKALLETLTGFSMYQGLLAVGKVPPVTSLTNLLREKTKPWLFVAADGLSSAENLGALVRNCAAFGVTALLTSESCTSPFLRRAVRSSMGTIFELPVIERVALSHALAELRASNVRCVAAHARPEALSITEISLEGDICVVLGSEGHGLSPEALEQCQQTALIPMAETVDSLNVATAAAVFLYEVKRQRGF